MKKTYRFLIALMSLFMAFGVSAQMAIPVDTTVRIGKLPNGLTYYIRHNETPKGQADFYIAQNVGSIQEEDNQRGLAHFLEHMCFNGTQSFPGNKLIEWLESVGVKFGRNLNAYTSIDRTVYNISNVPIDRKGVQDSCLIILHDWADGLLLDPEEIEKERGVIHQEWRRSMVGQMRILENLLPVMYPNGNRYGYRLPIGTMEVVDNFKPQVLRDYYETWYRPDNQAIIVVGDIDVDYIEGKIKELFSPIKMPENPKERIYYPVEDTPGTIYAIGRDPEQQVGIIEFLVKTDAFPRDKKSDISYLIVQYIESLIGEMLDDRLTELGKKADAPFAQAGATIGNYLMASTKDNFGVVGVAKGNDLRPVLESIYRELLRAKRGGFTVGEYERARAEYLSRLEKQFENRTKRESSGYVNEYVQNFTEGEPIPPIEFKYSIMQQIAPNITVDMINQTLDKLVTDDNRVILAMMPEKEDFYFPKEEELAAIIAKVDAEDIEPYKDQMKEEPLIPQLPAPGTVVKQIENKKWGTTELVLSNGVKVIVKKTSYKPNEIIFQAIALGGSSTVDESEAENLKLMSAVLGQRGLGTYTNSDLQKYLQGKQASVRPSIGLYTRTISGNSTKKDLPTLMEMLYMTFGQNNITEDEFAAMQNMYRGVLANQQSDPQYVFSKNLYKTLYKSKAVQPLEVEDIDKADRNAILKIANGMFSNAADYTFVFVGDIDMETFIPLVEQYIATLPVSSKVNNKVVVNPDREVIPGSGTDTFTTAMQTPQTWVYIGLQADMPYTPENVVLSSVASQILSKRLLNKIREEMGAVYSISASGGMSRAGSNPVKLQIPFPMKPELKDSVLAEIKSMIYDMQNNISDDELNPVKEYMVKEAREGLEKNNPWLSGITGELINGVDTFTTRIDTVNGLTTDAVKAFMKNLVGQNNYRVVILDPETTETK